MNNLPFNFNVDKSANTVFIDRAFNAALSLVWDAFTQQEMLDHWWAPKPYLSKTIKMDFREGGRRFYAMTTADGVEIGWHIQDYTSISPKTNFKFLSVFADKDENPFLPGSHWDLNFSEQAGITTVSITIYNESLERMEKMIEMGFKEGFTATLNELATLLSNIKQ
jgi:uncharacterized protein YndB with AHSA1/START domain